MSRTCYTECRMSGKLFLILGPSGSGKGTVISYLRRNLTEAVFPLSCTTREPRPRERDGEVYHFISKGEFRRRIDAGEFLEWAIVHNDNYYGTLKDPIMASLDTGKMVIREVDMQGVESIRELLGPERVIAIFITAPSWETLKERILKRSSIPDAELAHRKASFEKEMAYSPQCDFVVTSLEGEIPKVCREVEEIIRNEMAAEKPPMGEVY
ncbi:guanylate kinase [Candidatus Peregrinibacteria bacterium CG_4_9_14_0_2_um_filter_53_11]|nr:MAG: guanylate kinase [Candidatus Peregrinibacteria bacterium CG_4_9_14_0_2_um_filter_53_11]